MNEYLKTPKFTTLAECTPGKGPPATPQEWLRTLAAGITAIPETWRGQVTLDDAAKARALADDLDEHEIAVANMEMAYQDALTRV